MLDTHRRRATLRKKHRAAVLEEMVKQKTENGNSELDWEKIRAAAEPYSKETAQIAHQIALEDAGMSVPKKAKATAGKKKGGGLFCMFKGKSKK